MNSLGTHIYNAAKIYANVVETGASIAYNVTDATVSCMEGIFSTTAAGWNQGLKNSLKACVKYSLGVDDYRKAVEAFRKKPPAPVPFGNGTQIVDMRPMGQRIGEFTGHMINGGLKAVVIPTGTAALVSGAVSKAIWADKDLPGIGEFHNASRKLVEGACLVGQCVAKVGAVVLQAGWEGAKLAGSLAYNHPHGAFSLTAGGATLYFASTQIVKAGNAESYTRKAGHAALAVLGLSATLLIPQMSPFKS